ncbi:restriction endonuclease [TM7 phylum sp. oral taxon 353]|nr:restriction endonuclease [TM7 phylum sp. oral taxon 353]
MNSGGFILLSVSICLWVFLAYLYLSLSKRIKKLELKEAKRGPTDNYIKNQPSSRPENEPLPAAPAPAAVDQPAPENSLKTADQELLDKIRALDAYSFKKYVAEIFKSFGYQTKVTPYNRDNGIDIIMRKNNLQSYVQCKKHNISTVEASAVKDFYEPIASRINGGFAFIITINSFSEDAKRFAKNPKYTSNIMLIDGQRLIRLIQSAERTSSRPIPFPGSSISTAKAEAAPVKIPQPPRQTLSRQKQKRKFVS